MPSTPLVIVGYGSQARAWAKLLRLKERSVVIAFRADRLENSPQALAARADGFRVESLEKVSDGSKDLSFVAFLCPDHVISEVYNRYFRNSSCAKRFVIAHGFAVHSGALKVAPGHRVALLAPKAIGPQLLALGEQAHRQGGVHRLKAAADADALRDFDFLGLARDLGFARENLIEATFDQETIGDLISEQGLLCGGMFTLLDWTIEEMQKAKVPEALIREECLSELELIATLLRELGPEKTFAKISDAAKYGTIRMRETFDESDLKPKFSATMERVRSGQFAREYLNHALADTSKPLQLPRSLSDPKSNEEEPRP